MDIRSMHSLFSRHDVDKDSSTHRLKSAKHPSAGFIVWLLRGGEAGKTPTDRHARALNKA
jgi:hypothetical protein